MNMNIGDAHGGRGRRGSLPPPAAAAIAVFSIAVSSIVANPSTDHVPGGGSVTDGTAEGAKMGEDGSGIATDTPAASAAATVATVAAAATTAIARRRWWRQHGGGGGGSAAAEVAAVRRRPWRCGDGVPFARENSSAMEK